jgi:hypothetical protein
MSHFSAISRQEQVIFDEMIMMSVLYSTNILGNSTSSLKQSTGRHVAPLDTLS